MGELITVQAVSYLVTAVCAGVIGFLLSKAKSVARIFKTVDDLTLMVCRMSIYNDHFSIDEKVDAYRTYREYGGNSKTKHYMDDLLGEDADDYLAHHK